MSTQIEETASIAPPSAPSTPEPAAPSVATPAPNAAPAKPETLRETIARAAKTPSERGKHAQHQPRDNGKFAGPPNFPTPAPVAPVAPTRPEMPKSLKAELKAHWETAHPDLATAVHQRELDYEKGVAPLKEKARVADELLKEFEPYQMLLRAQGATPTTAVRSLLQTSAIFHTGSSVQKANAVASLMRQFGISPQDLQQVLSGNSPTQPAIDPQFQQLSQQVQQLTQFQQQQDEAQRLAAANKFFADPANKYAETVAERMVSLLSTPAVLGQDAVGASHSELLKLAYDAACRLDPEVSAKIHAEQQANDLAARQQQGIQQVTQARNAAVSVSGVPTFSPTPQVNPKDLRALIASQVRAQR